MNRPILAIKADESIPENEIHYRLPPGREYKVFRLINIGVAKQAEPGKCIFSEDSLETLLSGFLGLENSPKTRVSPT